MEEGEVVNAENEEKYSSHSRVNHIQTTLCFHGYYVLVDTNHLSIPMSEVELICKSSNEISAGGGSGEGKGGREVQQPFESQS